MKKVVLKGKESILKQGEKKKKVKITQFLVEVEILSN